MPETINVIEAIDNLLRKVMPDASGHVKLKDSDLDDLRRFGRMRRPSGDKSLIPAAVRWAKCRALDELAGIVRRDDLGPYHGYSKCTDEQRERIKLICTLVLMPETKEALAHLADAGFWNGNADTFWETVP